MPVITDPQEPSWESNVYFIVTTRIFVLMGTAYLVRSLYILVSAIWGSRVASTVACKHCFVHNFLLMTVHMADHPFMSCSYYEQSRPRRDRS